MERKIDEWEKSQNISSEQIERTDPPPPQAHTEHVNVVLTGSGKSDDSPKNQKDPPPIIVNNKTEKDKPIKTTKKGYHVVQIIHVKNMEDKGILNSGRAAAQTEGSEEEISPTTLEAAKILSKVASQKSKSVDKGKRYKRRKESKGKDISTGSGPVSTGLGVTTGSRPVSTGLKLVLRTKEHIQQEDTGLAEAIECKLLEEEETAKQGKEFARRKTCAKNMVEFVNERKKFFVEERAKAREGHGSLNTVQRTYKGQLKSIGESFNKDIQRNKALMKDVPVKKKFTEVKEKSRNKKQKKTKGYEGRNVDKSPQKEIQRLMKKS
ncbi:hypothetical protein Tco_0098135 [Tanacetum coccineum]